MSTIQQLREQRKPIAEELHNLVNDFPEDKQWGDDEQNKYNDLVNKVERIDADIERKQKVVNLAAEQHQKRVIDTANNQGISTDEAEFRVLAQKKAFQKWAANGRDGLNEDERKLLAERMNSPRNAMSTGTGSEGGYLTQEEFASSLTEAMKAFGGMRSVSNVIQTETGSDMNFPTSDYTSEEGEIVGENAAVSNADTTFGNKVLNTFKYSSKSIAIPFELLQDSIYDIEAHVERVLSRRLGNITNKHYTIGTNTGQPEGIIPAASVGVTGTTGQTTSVTFDDLLALEHSVDPAYRNGAAFMMHDQSLLKIKQLKDGQNRPLWLPSLVAGAPATINGYDYVINQHMDQMAANAKSIAFGNFSTYVIRDVMQVLFLRMTDSKYAEKGQVGFLAFFRTGGKFTDVGGAVKVYQNSAT